MIASLLYIPITKMIVSVWICDTKQCATGEWYPLPSPTFNLGEMLGRSTDRMDEVALLDSLAGRTDGCEPCAFLANRTTSPALHPPHPHVEYLLSHAGSPPFLRRVYN